MFSAINADGIKMRIIEIIRTHKWERVLRWQAVPTRYFGNYFPDYFKESKLFQCKRCKILLDIRTSVDKTDNLYRAAGIKNLYLFNDPGLYLGSYKSSDEISTEHNCSQRLIRKALM